MTTSDDAALAGAPIARDRTHELLGQVIGLNIAASKGNEQVAIGLLFGLGLLLGLAVAPVIADYANNDPSALWQAAGATAAFIAACGAYGYATRRDLSSWPAPSRCQQRRRDRCEHLPRRLQRLPALARPVRRRAGLAT